MKGKTRWLALLLAACMLVLCGCGKNAVNKEESQPFVQETAETVQETEEPVEGTAEPETSTEPTEETAPSAEDPAEKAEETAKPDGNKEEPAEPEAGTEAEAATEPEEEEPEASEKPESSAKPEPSAEPEPGNAAVEEQSAEDANQAEPPVTEEKTEEASATESPEEESEPAEAEEAAAETAPAEEEPESAPEAEETAESAPEAEEPEVRRTVEITVPAEYADVRYRIGEVTWNPDDSATYRLTEEEHEQLLEEVRSEIQSELNDMCASPYFLDFYSMTANEDCTVFTVVCLSIETTKAEQKSIPQLYKFGRMYAAYAGREPGNIHIDYMNKSGNTFVTRDSERDEGQASIG